MVVSDRGRGKMAWAATLRSDINPMNTFRILSFFPAPLDGCHNTDIIEGARTGEAVVELAFPSSLLDVL